MTRSFSVMIYKKNSELRKNVREYIERNFSPVIVTECESKEYALRMLNKRTYDMIFIDIDSPETNGIEMVRRISLHHPGSTIIILSAYRDHDLVHRALQAGASGCVVKQDIRNELGGSCDGSRLGISNRSD